MDQTFLAIYFTLNKCNLRSISLVLEILLLKMYAALLNEQNTKWSQIQQSTVRWWLIMITYSIGFGTDKIKTGEETLRTRKPKIYEKLLKQTLDSENLLMLVILTLLNNTVRWSHIMWRCNLHARISRMWMQIELKWRRWHAVFEQCNWAIFFLLLCVCSQFEGGILFASV